MIADIDSVKYSHSLFTGECQTIVKYSLALVSNIGNCSTMFDILEGHLTTFDYCLFLYNEFLRHHYEFQLISY